MCCPEVWLSRLLQIDLNSGVDNAFCGVFFRIVWLCETNRMGIIRANLTAASGRCGVQTGTLGDGQASELLGGGRMDADGVLQDLDGQTASALREGKLDKFVYI